MAESNQLPVGTSLHPKYYAKKIEPGMKLPTDMRLLRDVKLSEVPMWIARRDFSPLGIFFAAKRWKHGYWSKYAGRRVGGAWLVQAASVLFLASYAANYSWLRQNEQTRKYH